MPRPRLPVPALWCKASFCELAEPPLPELTGGVSYPQQKPSKAQKRREQKSKEEVRAGCVLTSLQALTVPVPQAEREARIAEENSNMGPSSRVVEEAALIEKLSVRVHCMA